MSQKLTPQVIQNHIRAKIDSSYNKQLFQQELNEVVSKKLYKIEEDILKDMKQKLLLQQKQQKDEQKRKQKKLILQQKIRSSLNKKEKQNQLRKKYVMEQNRQRTQLFQKRLEQKKKKQLDDIEQKFQKLVQKSRAKLIIYNKPQKAVSLIDEPLYYSKLNSKNDQVDIRLSDNSKHTASQVGTLNKRQLSLRDIYEKKPQKNEKRMSESQYASPQKEKQKMQLKINMIQKMQKKAEQLQKQRLEMRVSNQNQKQQKLISRLSKSVASLENPISLSSRSNTSSRNLSKGSILFEQSQERSKYSYLKQINFHIKEYMKNYKRQQMIKNK